MDFYVISYDVQDDKRRLRNIKHVENLSRIVPFIVFFGLLWLIPTNLIDPNAMIIIIIFSSIGTYLLLRFYSSEAHEVTVNTIIRKMIEHDTFSHIETSATNQDKRELIEPTFIEKERNFRCPKCGKWFEEEPKFCHRCGNNMKNSELDE